VGLWRVTFLVVAHLKINRSAFVGHKCPTYKQQFVFAVISEYQARFPPARE